jgi:DNA mismatch endonuclease (patch repair protein)
MDKISKEKRSRNMSAIKAKDTTPELFVRRFLHGYGYRYSLYKNNLPGKPDLYLRKYKAVVFIHGCFWHQHLNCRYAAVPKSNIDFWHPKLRKNVERDKQNLKTLKKMGYCVFTLWECEIRAAQKGSPGKALKRLISWLAKQNAKEN